MALKPRPRKDDHVRVNISNGVWECSHCGDVYRMNMPVSVDVYTAALRAYGRRHRECPKPKPPP